MALLLGAAWWLERTYFQGAQGWSIGLLRALEISTYALLWFLNGIVHLLGKIHDAQLQAERERKTPDIRRWHVVDCE